MLMHQKTHKVISYSIILKQNQWRQTHENEKKHENHCPSLLKLASEISTI